MVQFYALSVFVNIAAGLLLSANGQSEKSGILLKLREILEEKGVRFSLGLFALLIGFFKILTPMQGDVPVIGDLFPAVSGLALGLILVLDFMKSGSEVNSETIERVDSAISKHSRYIGIAGILSGVLHFLMPGVPII
jgi:hypothetical protein